MQYTSAVGNAQQARGLPSCARRGRELYAPPSLRRANKNAQNVAPRNVQVHPAKVDHVFWQVGEEARRAQRLRVPITEPRDLRAVTVVSFLKGSVLEPNAKNVISQSSRSWKDPFGQQNEYPKAVLVRVRKSSQT